jgi:hypothetical protein
MVVESGFQSLVLADTSLRPSRQQKYPGGDTHAART